MSAVDSLTGYTVCGMDEVHLAEVLAIERASYSNPWVEDAFRHELEHNGFSRPRVAITSDEPRAVAGYCIFWIVFEQVQIQNLAVHPLHRRFGLARHLLLCALEEGKDAGADSAQLEVRGSNTAALQLYRSLGFDIIGERKDYYSRPREDAVLLSRELT